MSLRLPRTPHQALRLAATGVTVLILLLLGGLGAGHRGDGPTYHRYVAMGDSFTAAPFVPLTDIASGCFRSSNNYPHLVAAALHIAHLSDRSCTGAETKDLPGRQRTSLGLTVPPQLAALSARTDLVTLGIGANNYHLYARMATVCRRSIRICPLYDERATLGAIVDQVEPALVSSIDQVKRLAPNARILLVSYPKLLPARGDCPLLPRMRPQDRATFRDINYRLRNQMRAAAAQTQVEFVDFYTDSIGHDICSRHPWIQGRNGNRRGAALHPLAGGEAALARLIEDVLRTSPPSTL